MSQAVVWAKAQDVGNPVAKAVLVCLASWADADDEAWASVPTMSLELERSERTIQRGLAWLLGKRDNETDAALAPKFIRDTGRKKLTGGRFVPIYGFDLDCGPANTKQRIAIERACAARVDKAVRPVTPVSPQEIYGCQTEHPPGDIGDIRPVTPVSPVLLEAKAEPKEEPEASVGAGEADGVGDDLDGVQVEAAFNRVWTAWAGLVPDGLARPFDWAAWVAAAEMTGDPAGLERAALRYLTASPAVKRGRGKSLAKWLAEEGWRQWAPAEPGPPKVVAVFDGPADFMAAVRAERHGDWIASWLSPCRWEDGRIVAGTGFAADTLKRELRRLLAEFAIEIIVRKAAAP